MLPFFLKVGNKSSDTFYINQQYSKEMEHLNPYSIECSCRCKGSCIKGFGEKKYDQFGEDILKIINSGR